jgi:hypothetical protein
VTTRSHVLATWSRYLAAVALLGVGLDHLEQFAVEHYSAIPTIGTLFALNFAAATLLACGLAAPVHRLRGRAGRLAVPLLSAGGIAVAVGSLVGLLLSERTNLFGFMEVGYRPAILLSIVLESTTAVLLVVPLAATARRRRPAAPDQCASGARAQHPANP